MTYPFEVPSYVQGYRFSDESEIFYDAATKTFRDLAGYGARADLAITAGSPVFATVNERRGVTLDNTFHGRFNMPIPWMGSVVAVLKPEYVSGGTLSRYPLLFGDNLGTLSSNGQMRLGHFSGARSVNWTTPSAVLNAAQSRNDNNLVVVGFATDQETRKGYATSNGITVTETGPVAGTTNGNGPAVGSAQFGARFGDMDGQPANLTQITDFFCHMFELHFFAENIWVAHQAKAQSLMTALRTKYGVA
jgi:hypothetical protein